MAETKKISFLMNSIHFFLHPVFIINTGNGFRLIVIDTIARKNLLIDNNYKTIRGARIAFTKFYRSDHYYGDERHLDKKANWSKFYVPENKWLSKIRIKL